jgi:glutathione synthase/RimK-type ligase-like ATP-grasp enzyme
VSKTLERIGSKEFVSLPDYQITQIPAKVDTGADYSSIWASDITEKDGILSFKLFGSGSKLYTGQTLTTEEYGVTEVRNSFGDSEIRYTVKMAMVLGAKRTRVNFRLADRSRNRYPVLIGKKTLHGKFLVDVSVNNRLGAGKARILVLNSLPSRSVASFVDKITKADPSIKASFRTYDDIMLVLSGKAGIRLYNAETKKRLPRYDLIYFKTHEKKMEFASAIAEYAEATNTNHIDREVSQFRSYSKLSQYARLARFGLPIPRTVVMHHSHMADSFDFLVEKLKLPFIFKDVAADKGESNFLIGTREEFEVAVKEAAKNGAYFAAQEFIANDGDYRCLVLDKKLALVIKRLRQDDTTHLNNTSTGGSATLIDPNGFSAPEQTMAIKAAIVLGRQVAGVDLMQSSKTGKWYILEVNNSPQIASGAFVEEKVKVVAKFLREQAEK